MLMKKVFFCAIALLVMMLCIGLAIGCVNHANVIAIIAIGVPVVAYTMSKMNEHSEE